MVIFLWFLCNRTEDGFVIELKLREKHFCAGNKGIQHSGKTVRQNKANTKTRPSGKNAINGKVY